MKIFSLSRGEATQRALDHENEDEEELRILIWGITGAGKSSFIDSCGARVKFKKKLDNGREEEVEERPEVGKGTSSKTQEVKAYALDHKHGRQKKRVILIDIPGFNDGNKDAGKIFVAVATFLNMLHKHYGRRPWLHGIIYVHSLTNERFTDADKQCFTLLERLCGNESQSNTWIVLSKGDRGLPFTTAAKQYKETEEGLKKTVWPEYASRVIRKGGVNAGDARKCIEHIWDAKPVTLKLMTEMSNDISLGETASGKYLISAMLIPRINLLNEKLKDKSPNSDEFAATMKALQEVEREKKELFKIDRKVMESIAYMLHSSAGVVFTTAVPFAVSPACLHIGIPLLVVAGFLETLAMGAQIFASRRDDTGLKSNYCTSVEKMSFDHGDFDDD